MKGNENKIIIIYFSACALSQNLDLRGGAFFLSSPLEGGLIEMVGGGYLRGRAYLIYQFLFNLSGLI